MLSLIRLSGMSRSVSKALFAAAAFWLIVLGAEHKTQAVTWVGTTSDLLDTANWNPTTIPNVSDGTAANRTASFFAAGSHTPVLNANWNPRYLDFNGNLNGDYIFTGSGTLTIGSDSRPGNIDTWTATNGDVTLAMENIVLYGQSPIYTSSNASGTSNLLIDSNTLKPGAGTTTGPVFFYARGGNLTINPTVDFSENTVNRQLSLQPNANKVITLVNGVAPTPTTGLLGTLFAEGQVGGKIVLGNSTTWAGVTDIYDSSLEINHNTSLGAPGSSSSGYTRIRAVEDSATRYGNLSLTNDITVAEFIRMDGRPVDNTAPHIVNKSGTNTFTGTLRADGGAAGLYHRIHSEEGQTLIIAGTGEILSNAAGSVLVFSGDGDYTIAGKITQSGSGTWAELQKAGAGTLTLSNSNNDYAGTTSVLEGTVIVNGNNNGSGAFNVGEFGILKGSGQIAGAVNVNGGIFAPGSSIESLATGSLTLNDGATFEYEIDLGDNFADLSVVNGDLTLGIGVALDALQSGDAFNIGDKIAVVNYSGDLIGEFDGLADGATFDTGTNVWQINYDVTSATGLLNFTGDYLDGGKFITLTAVPEPSAILLGGIGVAGLAWVGLRRRK